MSDLKYLNLDDLYEAERNTGRLINYRQKKLNALHKSIKYHHDSMNGQITRLQWIRKYIAKKLDVIGYKDIGSGI